MMDLREVIGQVVKDYGTDSDGVRTVKVQFVETRREAPAEDLTERRTLLFQLDATREQLRKVTADRDQLLRKFIRRSADAAEERRMAASRDEDFQLGRDD